MMDNFNIGDTVWVVKYGIRGFAKRCLVERKCENGNVLVEGQYFNKLGRPISKVSNYGRKQTFIYKDTPEVYEKHVKPVHFYKMKANISKHVKDATYEDMKAIYAILKKEQDEKN